MQQIKERLLEFGCESRIVDRYVKVLEASVNDEIQEKHHALPKSVFPDFITSDWNLIGMSARRHFVCHILLYKMKKDCPQFQRALWFMAHTRGFKVDSKTYSDIKLKNKEFAASSMSAIMRGKATFKDEEGNHYHLNVDDPMIHELGLKHVSCDTLVVHDRLDGLNKRIHTSAYRSTVERYVSINKGRKHRVTRKGYVVVKDEFGQTFATTIDDPKYKSGTLKHLNAGTVNVVMNGKPKKVSKEEFDSGNFTSLNKGKIDVVDSNGNPYKVHRDDPRVVSGELVPKPKSAKALEASSKSITEYNLSCRGKKWMTSPDGKSKQIPPQEVDFLLSKGWSLGRVIEKKIDSSNNGCNGSKWMTSPEGDRSVFVRSNEIDERKEKGWTFGRKK